MTPTQFAGMLVNHGNSAIDHDAFGVATTGNPGRRAAEAAVTLTTASRRLCRDFAGVNEFCH